MADEPKKPLSPLEQKLANLQAKRKSLEAAPKSQFEHGGKNDDPDAHRREAIARTDLHIQEVRAALKDQKPVTK